MHRMWRQGYKALVTVRPQKGFPDEERQPDIQLRPLWLEGEQGAYGQGTTQHVKAAQREEQQQNVST